MDPQPANISSPPMVVGFINLGCPKNLIDGERMLANLALSGYVVTGDLDVADVGVVNTCGFIEAAREEAGEVIDELMDRKRDGRLQMVVVAGCYPQRSCEEILDRWPDVDAVVGLSARNELGHVIARAVQQKSDEPVLCVGTSKKAIPFDDRERLRLTPRHYAYLRISEGCDNCCSYCSIPLIRGRLRSKPAEAIVEEARELLDDGVSELIVIGQDTTAYGRDLKDKRRDADIVDVLGKLDRLPGMKWLRLLYTHPASFSDRLVGAFGDLEHLLPYVDLPLQHVSDPILADMGRRTTRAAIEELVGKLRRCRPDLILRTTMIVGYPGETEPQFEEMLGFVRQMRFERLGAFAYSPEPGTRAAESPHQVPEDVRHRRYDELMSVQQSIAAEIQRQTVGHEMDVVIDRGTDGAEPAHGRFWGQAPDIDGLTVVHSTSPLQCGRSVRVKITSADPYDLEGQALDE
ncbi:MAG: 30S ribosomal protein S12 methylthiotransferase RimO [Planctomycetes bacterium]|nr:30S ribosomal protein S12 methylthiotransferase RimO [Planctomycetota bacterium]